MDRLDTRQIRKENEQQVRRMGYEFNPHLPLIEPPKRFRSVDEICRRTLALFCVVAVANNSRREVAVKWLQGESLFSELTPTEQTFISSSTITDKSAFLAQEESLWALVWVLGFVNVLDFSTYCQPVLASLFPNVRAGETSDSFKHRAALRRSEDIVKAIDLAYCIHWAVRDATVNGRSVVGSVPPYVVVERRRALEWIIGEEDWENVALDT
jgi:hypothetical protein